MNPDYADWYKPQPVEKKRSHHRMIENCKFCKNRKMRTGTWFKEIVASNSLPYYFYGDGEILFEPFNYCPICGTKLHTEEAQ